LVFRVKIAPSATLMSHRVASSKVPLLELWYPFVARFGLIDRRWLSKK
jgi:hypothetical protein